MQNRYRLIRKRGIYYFHDKLTGIRESTQTRDKAAAGELLFAKNQSAKQPALNVAMARAYLSGKSPESDRWPHWSETGNLGLGECRHPRCGCTRFKPQWATENCLLALW